MFSFTERCKHELRRRPCKSGARRVSIPSHSVLINPHDSPEALHPYSLLILHKVPHKEALILRLYKLVMALSTARGRSTRSTHRRSLDPRDSVTTRTLQLH